MKMASALEKAHEQREVDLGTAARGVWLVKVSFIILTLGTNRN